MLSTLIWSGRDNVLIMHKRIKGDLGEGSLLQPAYRNFE